jgi:hypothetical protein
MAKDSLSTINLRLILPGSKNKEMKLKLIKKNTVHIRRPLFVGKNKTNPQPVPLISISGKILDYYGFEIGRLFDVYARKGFLLFIARKFKYKKRIKS